MPTVKPVAKPATPSANPVPHAPQNPPQTTYDTPSPVARPQQSGGGLSIPIPAFLQQTSMPDTVDGEMTGFVGFGSDRSKNWGALSASGVANGMPYISKDNAIVPLPTLKFWLLRGDSFQTLMVGQEGKFQFATRDLELEGPSAGTNRMDEHYIGLLIVETPNGLLVPVKGDFRGTKSGGLKSPINAVKAASTVEWCNQSDAHKAASAFPEPWGRVVHSVTTKREVGKSSGNEYFRCACVCRPTTVTEIQKLVQAFNDADFNRLLSQANDNYNARVQFLDDVASGKVKNV